MMVNRLFSWLLNNQKKVEEAVEDYYRKEFNIPDDFHGSIDYNVTSEYKRYP